jgi:hypothetical protein
MLNVIMLNVIMLNYIMLNVIMPNVIYAAQVNPLRWVSLCQAICHYAECCYAKCRCTFLPYSQISNQLNI